MTLVTTGMWILAGFVGALIARFGFILIDARSWESFKHDYCNVGLLGLVGIIFFSLIGPLSIPFGLLISLIGLLGYTMIHADTAKTLFNLCPWKKD